MYISPTANTQSDQDATHASDLRDAVNESHLVWRELSSLVGDTRLSCNAYARDIYHQWWDAGTRDTILIGAAVRRMNVLLGRATKSHSIILQLDGVGPLLSDAGSLCRKFREVVCMLEDIMCSALISRKEAKKVYAHKGYLFQNE